jgi:parallel beta-helix repeat protein
MLISLWLPWCAEALTFYVATTGSNSANDCTEAQNISTPKATVSGSTGAGACASAGDTIFLRAGTYTDRWFNSFPGGTSGSPTIISAYQNETVILQANSPEHAVTIQDSQHRYITFKKLIIDGTDSVFNCVKISSTTAGGFATNIRFEDGTIRNCKTSGVLITKGSNNNTFVRMKFHDTGQDGTGHGLYFGSSGNLVEHSEAYDNAKAGIHAYNDATGEVNNNVIRYNYVHDNGTLGVADGNAEIVMGSGSGNVAYGNIATGGGRGITVGYSCTNCLVYNNTFYNNDIGINIRAQVSGLIVRNNLLLSNTDQIANAATGVTLSNNACSSSDTGCDLTSGSSQVVNAAGGDFALLATSIAINAGTSTITTGVTVAGNGTPDIGAYETFTISNCAVNGTTLTANLNPLRQPLNGGALAEFAVTYAGVGQTESNLVVGTNTISLTLGAAPADDGVAVVLTYTPGGTPVRDSSLIGNLSTNGQRLNAQTVTCSVSGAGSGTPTVVQLDAVSTPLAQQGTNTFSLTHTGSSDVKLAALLACVDSQTAQISNPTYGGVPMVFQGRAMHDIDSLAAELWTLVNPPTGAQTVQVPTTAPTVTEVVLAAATFEGVDTVNPVSGLQKVESGTGNSTLTIDSASGDLVWSISCLGDPTFTVSAGTGETEHYDTALTTILRGASYSQAGDTSVAMTPQLSGAGARVQLAFNLVQFGGTTASPVATQVHYKVCEVDAPEGAHCGAEDTPYELPAGGCARVHTGIGIATADAPAQGWPFYWRASGSGSYVPLDADTTDSARLGQDAVMAFGTEITTSGLSLNGRTFRAGAWYVDTPGQFPAVAIQTGEQGEFGTVVCAHPSLTTSDYLEIRQHYGTGDALDTYTNTARINIVPLFAKDR